MSEREGKLSNPRARCACDAWRKFTEIYGNPRAGAARALCIDFLPVIGTVVLMASFEVSRGLIKVALTNETNSGEVLAPSSW